MAEDLVITVGADLGPLNKDLKQAEQSVAQTVQKLKEAQIGLAHETRGLSAEYNKNAKALKELYDIQKGGLGVTGQTINKIKALEQTQRSLSASIVDSKGVYKDAANVIKDYDKSLLNTAKPAGGLSNVYTGLKALKNIIPGLGIASLVGLVSGPLVEALATWYEGLNKVSNATQILQERQKDVNDIMKDANKEAGKQTADLSILYQAATNVNLSMKDRLLAVKGLQDEFPSFFKNIKAETILNGGAKDQYIALAKSIQETARAKAALGKLGEIEAEQLNNDFQRQKVIIATTNEINEARKKGNVILRQGMGAPDIVYTSQQIEAAVVVRREAALKDLATNDKILQGRRDFITKFVGLSKLAAAVEADIKPPKPEKAAKAIKEIALEISKGAKVAKIEVPIDITGPKPSQLYSTIQKFIIPIVDQFADMTALLQDSFLNLAEGLGEALGNALSGGGHFLRDALGGVFNIMGNFLVQLGKAAVLTSKLFLAIKASKANPIVGIIGGIAAIVAGTILKNIQLPFATGGYVSGPGTKTSDSINARLSTGEYVIKADSVSKYGKSFFDMINGGGFSRNNNFANGGPVNTGSIGGGQLITVLVEGNLRGTDLYISNKRTALKIGRNG